MKVNNQKWVQQPCQQPQTDASGDDPEMVEMGGHKIPKKAFEHIRLLQRDEIMSTEMKAIKDKFDGLDLGDSKKSTDAIEKLASKFTEMQATIDALKKGEDPDKQPLSEQDIELKIAERKQELDKEYAAKEEKSFFSNVKEQIKSKAIAGKLKDQYEEVFDKLVETLFIIDKDQDAEGNMKPIFRNNDVAKEIILTDTQGVVDKVKEKFPDAFGTPKKGWEEKNQELNSKHTLINNGKDVKAEDFSLDSIVEAGLEKFN